MAGTPPSGTIADAAFEYLRDDLLQRLRDVMPVDVVALSLHGAGAAESYPDIEGALVQAVRRLVGPGVPIVGTFDLHGNISDECAAAFDYMVPVWYCTGCAVDATGGAEQASLRTPSIGQGASALVRWRCFGIAVVQVLPPH